jgi:hypothetical protein
MALLEGIQTSLWAKESNGAFPSCWHCFASLLAVKGSFPAPSAAPLTAAARCEPPPTMEGKEETATPPSLTNLALFRVHAVVRSKKYLTPPALLSRWEKAGRGGTEDDTVKLLSGIQRVQVPPGQSRAGSPVASVAIHRVTGGCEAYTARKRAVKIQLRKLGWLRGRRR